MTLINQNDFNTKSGQQKIIREIHNLESKLHQLENKLNMIAQKEESIERILEGPEAY